MFTTFGAQPQQQGIKIPVDAVNTRRLRVPVSNKAPAGLSMGDFMPGVRLNLVATGSDSIVFQDPITVEDSIVVEDVTKSEVEVSFKENDAEFFRFVDEAKSKVHAFDTHGYNATMKLAVLAVVA